MSPEQEQELYRMVSKEQLKFATERLRHSIDKLEKEITELDQEINSNTVRGMIHDLAMGVFLRAAVSAGAPMLVAGMGIHPLIFIPFLLVSLTIGGVLCFRLTEQTLKEYQDALGTIRKEAS